MAAKIQMPEELKKDLPPTTWGKVLQAARDNLRLRDDGFVLPDVVHAPMVNFPAADDKAFCRLAEKNRFV